MIPSTGHHVTFLQQQLEIDFRCQGAAETHAKIRLAEGNRTINLVGAGIQQFDFDLRIQPVKGADYLRHEVIGS